MGGGPTGAGPSAGRLSSLQPPGGSGIEGLALPPSKQGQPFADVHQNLRYVKSQFETGMKAQKVLDHLRTELDGLMDMGDMVRPENVIEAAGRLVGHGLGATQLAQIMSDMPGTGGEGLASWIRMHDMTVTQAEMSLAKENAVLGHRMAVAGIRSIAASHLEQTAMTGQQPTQHIGPGGPSPGGGAPGGGAPGGMAGEAMSDESGAEGPAGGMNAER